jgi:hypothetical protein
MGGWHQKKCFLETLLEMLDAYGGRELALIHSWNSPHAQDMLMTAKCVVKSMGFLRDGVKEAILQALAYNCRVELGKGDGSKLSHREFTAWTKKVAKEDVHIREWLHYVDLLHAFEMIAAGIRDESRRGGYMDMFDAGRIKLLPLLFSLHRTKYARAILEEICQIYHESPKVTRYPYSIFMTIIMCCS